ncbi:MULTISPECIES: SpoIIE family protein phosphatase [unclassified Modestobacter]|uniref:SpoIIE family protein phosphatase n=1 Tax=unclassified Modestobacter TaxID=2643866 RepID=UPI0022AAAF34|nr:MULTISPECIES: SpoIIE family protein phosphatase [unclassified Modestobacter]MCZ2822942.1 SpoIIE family protein phosphatase [Modestobacter sp. VKM Ac-2981]MCZ2851188.1 SpoIIE family protein phosphatase [Modestobacter sp. VKM Ac-2982]
MPDHAALFAAMPTPYLVLTPELVIADANPAYLATTGRTRDELIGRPVFEAFPGNPDATATDGASRIRASLERARDTCRPHTLPVQEFDIPDGSGGFTKHFWSLISVPVLDEGGRCRHLLQRAEDITDYVRQQAMSDHPSGRGRRWHRRVLEVESDLFARGAELRAARQAEADAARRLAALSGVALALGRAETLDDLARVVNERGLVALGAHGGAIGVCDGEHNLRLVLTDGIAPVGVGPDTVLSLDAPYPSCVAARTGERVLLPDRAATDQFSPQLARLAAETGVQAWAAVPLESGSRRIGSLSVGWTRPAALDQGDIELLLALAGQSAQALERIRARADERAQHAVVEGMAEALQRSLLTEPPETEHLQVAVRYLPAASLAQVGGDWYDAFLLGDGRLALVIGDVTGHDRHAAAAMAQVRNVLRGVAHSRRDSPGAVLGALDRALEDLQVATLATGVLATVEETGTGGRLLRWSNAGHPPPLLIDPDGTVTVLERAPDLLLGVDPSSPRSDHARLLVPGSTVVLYTDGLVERRGAVLDDGIDWLVDELARWAHLPLEELCDRLLGALEGAVEDDVAVLAVRVRG